MFSVLSSPKNKKGRWVKTRNRKRKIEGGCCHPRRYCKGDFKVYFSSLVNHSFTNKKGVGVIKMAKWIFAQKRKLASENEAGVTPERTTQQASSRNPASPEDVLPSLLGRLTS